MGAVNTPPAEWSLAERARFAARAREPDPPGLTGLPARRWRDQAAAHARTVAAMLGLDPLFVGYHRDPERNYGADGAWPGVLLVVADPVEPDIGYRLIPDLAGGYLGLAGCPACRRPTPAVRIVELADLARLVPDPTGRTPSVPVAERPLDFHGDPAHRPGCRHHRNPHSSSGTPTEAPRDGSGPSRGSP